MTKKADDGKRAKKKPIRLKKTSVRSLEPDDLNKAKGGLVAADSKGTICVLDTYWVNCTQYNCGYSYRNCATWTC